ncbi:cobalt-precorrin-5B (C(1))-methyltransferase CbiD [Marinilabilia salmonicolor]|nr:cobalt-precorrin-5B (C(1))-methyltransferase CbiD [Marinilabilia salmonicolor]
MDADAMAKFCNANGIRLIIDAAHPFAVDLHHNIKNAAIRCNITTLRFERPVPDFLNNNYVRFFDDFVSLEEALLNSDFENILALTGVQTIPKLRAVWQKRQCYFRILDTRLSRHKANKYGIPQYLVIPMAPDEDVDSLVALAKKTGVRVLLSKESGASGFIQSKIEAAALLKVPLWMVRRPSLPDFSYKVFSPKSFLQRFYHLRRELMQDKSPLRKGYTTGTCLTAAAKACFLGLMTGVFPDEVSVMLPDGSEAVFPVFPGSISDVKASCVVIKDAGDDADVIHGHEIGCELKICPGSGMKFLQGKGVGKVTLPGLQVPVGQPAINPVPRQMVTNLLEHLAEDYGLEMGFEVRAFVPEGEKLAAKTFNPRVGVVGGISIIGTSGRVIPFSSEAFLASIRPQLSVAMKTGCREVVLTSGKRSENLIRSDFSHLPDTAFVHFGNLIGNTIKMAVEEGAEKITLALMFAKSTKLAAGNLNTHSKNCRFNPVFVADIARDCGLAPDVIGEIESLKMANAVLDIIPPEISTQFYQIIATTCFEVCKPLIPENIVFKFVMLIGKESKIKIEYRSGSDHKLCHGQG